MMTFAGIRILAAFVIAYLLPALLRQRRKEASGQWWLLLLEGFALTTACIEVFALTLASIGLPYAGSLMALWLVIVALAAFGVRGSYFRPLLFKLLRRIESGHIGLSALPRWKTVTSPALLGLVLFLVIFLQRAWFSLNYWRFETLEGYERTFSLFQIVTGGAVNGNPSLPLLAPLMFIGGLDAASVVRFADPLFSTLGCVAAGLCAFALSKRYSAALLAVALMAVLPALTRASMERAGGAQQMATVFWLITATLAHQRRLSAVGSGLTAVLIGGSSALHPLLAIGCVVSSLAIDRVTRLAPAWIAVPARAAVVLSIAMVMIMEAIRPVPDGPYQYESAAIAAEQIARTFPRGQWFVISPTHELTSVLGRGWHIELVDFLKEYSEETVAPPNFKFPWEANIFIFAERQPLTRLNDRGGLYHGGHGMATIGERSVLSYGTPLGRAATQFQLASLIAAYARSHDNVSIYHQDEKLTVYRISRGAAPLSARNLPASARGLYDELN